MVVNLPIICSTNVPIKIKAWIVVITTEKMIITIMVVLKVLLDPMIIDNSFNFYL